MDDEYFSDFAFFSNTQYIVLFAFGLTSAILSISGSCIILYLITRGGRTGELYHRLVLGLSVSDLISTLSLLMQPVLVRKETGYIFAVGSKTSCSVVGFGYLYFVASFAYNCMLGIYFLAMTRYQVSSKTISRFMEPWGHLIAFSMPTALGIASVRFDMLNVNPFLGACALFPTNHECTWNDSVSCENDSAYQTLNHFLDFFALTTAAIGLICTICVWCTVRSRFRPNPTLVSQSNDLYHDAHMRRIQTISWQAIWYTAAYMTGLLSVVISNTVGSIYIDTSLQSLGNEPFFFATTLFLWWFFPLQGLFNCFVYIRPRLVRWKAYYEGESWWFAFQRVLSLDAPPRWGESYESSRTFGAGGGAARKADSKDIHYKGQNNDKGKSTYNGENEDDDQYWTKLSRAESASNQILGSLEMKEVIEEPPTAAVRTNHTGQLESTTSSTYEAGADDGPGIFSSNFKG